MNIAFTICTKSYYGLARIVRSSFLTKNSNFDEFYIIFADEVLDNDNYPEYVKIAHNCVNNIIDNNLYYQMAFKYDITEFCTALKPFIFNYFFNGKNNLVVYLDPDILFLSQFNELKTNKTIFITPHILTMEKKYSGDALESGFLTSGVFNCGFIGIRNNNIGNRIIEWWQERLKQFCFSEAEFGMFTDQKWIDFIPCLIDTNEIFVIRNYGCNIAPWNYYERKIFKENNQLYVTNRCFNDGRKELVVFVHFSGYDYAKLQNAIITHNYRSIKNYEDINLLFDVYINELKNENISSYFVKKYTYSQFDNGVVIEKFHRRLFEGLVEKDIVFSDPFKTGKNSFYYLLLKSKMINKKNKNNDMKKSNINNLDAKIKLLQICYKMLFNLLGYKKYFQFILSLLFFSRRENHIFLLKIKDSNYEK